MTSTTTGTETEHRCLSCGRRITSAESIAMGRGSGCRAKIRRAEREADLSAWTPKQAEQARELIEDGGLIETARPGEFFTVGSEGVIYLTTISSCWCPAGLKGKRCYHLAGVAIMAASQYAPDVQPLALAA